MQAHEGPCLPTPHPTPSPSLTDGRRRPRGVVLGVYFLPPAPFLAPFLTPSLWMGRSCTELAPTPLAPAACMTGMPKEGACHWGMSLVFHAEGS